MWRIFAAKPRTRLGRLSHARTHDDILDLVGHKYYDDDRENHPDFDDDCDDNDADSYTLLCMMTSLIWLVISVSIDHSFSC